MDEILSDDLARNLHHECLDLYTALVKIRDCKDSDLVEYCKTVDAIACEATAKYEGNI